MLGIVFLLYNRYGSHKVAEGVDGAELLTLHERGLMPLEGDGEGEREEGDDDEAPQLVPLPESMEVDEGGGKVGEEMDVRKEEKEEVEEKKGMDEEKEEEGVDDEEEGEDEEDEEDEEVEEEEVDEEEEEEEEESDGRPTKRVRRGKKSVKFASEAERSEGTGPHGAVGGGRSTDEVGLFVRGIVMPVTVHSVCMTRRARTTCVV